MMVSLELRKFPMGSTNSAFNSGKFKNTRFTLMLEHFFKKMELLHCPKVSTTVDLYNPIMAMGFSATYTFQLDGTKR